MRNSETKTSKTAFQTRASRGAAQAPYVLLLWQETVLSATQNYVTAIFSISSRWSHDSLWGVELVFRVVTIASGTIGYGDAYALPSKARGSCVVRGCATARPCGARLTRGANEGPPPLSCTDRGAHLRL